MCVCVQLYYVHTGDETWAIPPQFLLSPVNIEMYIFIMS